MKYIYILRTYLLLFIKIYWVRKRHTNRLFKELDQLTSKSHVLTEKLEKRIRFYTMQSFIVASWTCALRGKKLKRHEIKNVVYVGAITPILDDLTDTLKLSSSEILDLLNSNDEEATLEIVIARYLHQQLQNKHNEHFNKVFVDALISQDASIQQIEERRLSEGELIKIASDKGGTSTLWYRKILNPPVKQEEKEAFLSLGYIMQQINDMFDIYKDHVNHQQTLFTNSKNLCKNYEDYELSIQKMVSQFLQLDYKKKNIVNCLVEISTITSRGMVCLHQLTSLQGTSSEFDITKFSRRQLVCDMDDYNNIMKSIMFSIRFYDQVKAAGKK